MRDLIESLVFAFIIVMLIGCCYLVGTTFLKELAKEEMQASTYTECLATDYDKFQCYSMIYGDK